MISETVIRKNTLHDSNGTTALSDKVPFVIINMSPSLLLKIYFALYTLMSFCHHPVTIYGTVTSAIVMEVLKMFYLTFNRWMLMGYLFTE